MTETEHFEEEAIRRANEGDTDSARLVLELIAGRIDARLFDSPLFDYLASNLRLFLDNEISLERAFGIEPDLNRGGRPKKYDETEVAAVDLLLRDYAGLKPEKAIEWIEDNVGADRRFVQIQRQAYDARYNKYDRPALMESRSRDDLLEFSGSLREKVGRVFPQT